MKLTLTCGIDWSSVGHTAAHYLLEQGRFETFLDVAESGIAKDTLPLYAALRQTLRKNGFRGSVTRLILPGTGLGRKAGLIAGELADKTKPVAVIAENDRLALEVVAFALKAGHRVPEDVAVLGVGDDPGFCTRPPIALSSIRLVCERLGREALRRMLDPGAVADRQPASVVCAPIGIAERDSVHRIRPTDRYVARALDFIRLGDARDLRVDKIVAVCGASRSYLEKRFRAETGLAILDAVHVRKLTDIKRALVETDKPSAIIAEEAGFTSESGLCSFFKRETGQSMSAFRHARRPS